MKAAQLLEHFDRLSEAPGAVPRLRRFILDLAVRGKLVAQDAGDEPAALLLKRIKEQKLRLANEGLAKKEKTLLSVDSEERPFSIPDSWRWARLQDIASYIQRGKSPNYAASDGVPVVSQKCVQWRGLDLNSARLITRESLGKYEPVRFLQDQDLLWNSTGTGTIGRVVRVISPPKNLVCDSHVTVVRCALANSEYVRSWLATDHVYGSIEDRAAGATNQVELNSSMAAQQVVPIPPLAEQHRIVAKVDELMALCDQLEAAQQERERRRERLAAASLQRLNQPAADATPEAQREHARFHLHHLPRLTLRPEHIKAMRQTFLNLAVRGKLVEQDSNDEPAPQLFKRIQGHKAALIKDGKIKVQAEDKGLSRAERAYPIPPNWMWLTFGSIMISRDSDRIPVSKEERNAREKTYDYYGASGVIDKIDGYLFDKPLLLIGEDGANLINRSTPIAFIARGQYWVNNHAHVLDGIAEEFLQYIELYINAVDLKPYVTGTAQPKMNQAKMNSIPVALPPEAEQHRIVAKVDELMALCDQLEAQLTTTQIDSRRLLEAVLEAALTPV